MARYISPTKNFLAVSVVVVVVEATVWTTSGPWAAAGGLILFLLLGAWVYRSELGDARALIGGAIQRRMDGNS